MTESTPTQRLVKAMTESCCPQWMIERAKNDHYHDFKSPLATPQIQLVAELMANGQEALAERVINDEFAATEAEADEWFQSEGQFFISPQMAIALGFQSQPPRPKPRGFGKR